MSKERGNRLKMPRWVKQMRLATRVDDCKFPYEEWNISFSITFSAACYFINDKIGENQLEITMTKTRFTMRECLCDEIVIQENCNVL